MAATGNTLSGRTCLVTGAAGGLGKNIALALQSEGANVAVCDFSESLLNSVAAEFQQTGPTPLFLSGDVTDASAVKSLISSAVHHFGRLDVLVNCAGIFDRFEPVGDLGQDLWSKLFAVNVTGPFLLSKEAINHFLGRSATDASIINIGSLASEHGWCGGEDSPILTGASQDYSLLTFEALRRRIHDHQTRNQRSDPIHCRLLQK